MEAYRKRVAQFRKVGDLRGLEAFLRTIFAADDAQAVKKKPTDYMNDDDEKYVALEQVFELCTGDFVPSRTATEVAEFLCECREGYRDEEGEAKLRPWKPLNAIELMVGAYEWGDVVLSTGHYNDESGEFEMAYGLNHEIVDHADHPGDYDHVYALEHEDRYRLSYEGEKLAGGEVYHDIKTVVFGRFGLALVECLLDSE